MSILIKSIILDKNVIAIYCVFRIIGNEPRYMANMGAKYSVFSSRSTASSYLYHK